MPEQHTQPIGVFEGRLCKGGVKCEAEAGQG